MTLSREKIGKTPSSMHGGIEQSAPHLHFVVTSTLDASINSQLLQNLTEKFANVLNPPPKRITVTISFDAETDLRLQQPSNKRVTAGIIARVGLRERVFLPRKFKQKDRDLEDRLQELVANEILPKCTSSERGFCRIECWGNGPDQVEENLICDVLRVTFAGTALFDQGMDQFGLTIRFCLKKPAKSAKLSKNTHSVMPEPSPAISKKVKALVDDCLSDPVSGQPATLKDVEAHLEIFVAMRHELRDRLQSVFRNLLQVNAPTSYADRQKLVLEINNVMRMTGLAFQEPTTGCPASLMADHSSIRLQLKRKILGTKRSSGDILAIPIVLMEAPRKEAFAAWGRSAGDE